MATCDEAAALFAVVGAGLSTCAFDGRGAISSTRMDFPGAMGFVVLWGIFRFRLCHVSIPGVVATLSAKPPSLSADRRYQLLLLLSIVATKFIARASTTAVVEIRYLRLRSNHGSALDVICRALR